MKKLFLLPVLLFLLLTSCKEEDAPTPYDANQVQLEGSWNTVNQEFKFYSASGQLMHAETDEKETSFHFDAPEVTTTYNTGTRTTCTYTSFQKNGKDYLQFYHNGRLQDFEITSLTGSAMSWQVRLEKAQYGAGLTLKESDHVIVTIGLSKR
ncbi:hypothetical protein [Pontibacter pamirensis]|uniref:hypothetical protein n=1 Tax=Pontibacter pamirensis TaxID=2562824 RepID=UPI001389A8CE|nr:hypothetical protein [Pontibacter pamirensis]